VRYLGGRFDQIAFVKHEGKLWIVFIEIKSGGWGLEPRQNEVCDAIRDGRVSWDLIRILEGDEGARCVSKRRGPRPGALGTRDDLSR
jgi:predicted Holliday junction resolvase-like endonuclease